MKTAILTLIALTAFAANSLLSRSALEGGWIDPVSFSSIRIVSGAALLYLLALWKSKNASATSNISEGSWTSATALFGYAIAFSIAYVSLDAGTGALILFAAVQLTMMLAALAAGERMLPYQIIGYAVGAIGLTYLFWPGASAPDVWGSLLMALSGLAWGFYSIRGRTARSPLMMSAGNFARAIPLALISSAIGIRWIEVEWQGILLALGSGTLASGLGYVIWYQALRGLTRNQASTVQLLTPVLAAIGGVTLLGEPPSTKLTMASLLIIGGTALALTGGNKRRGDKGT